MERLGLQGLALGIAIGAWFEAITLTLLLHRRSAAVAIRPVLSGGAISLVGAVLAALSAGIILVIVTDPEATASFFMSLWQLALAAAVAAAVYLLYSRIVRLPELPRTVGLIRSALRPGGAEA